MGLITQHSASGYGCDKGPCLAKVSGEQMPIFLAEEHYRDLARSLGWSFWYGRRLWVFCPDHRPQPRPDWFQVFNRDQALGRPCACWSEPIGAGLLRVEVCAEHSQDVLRLDAVGEPGHGTSATSGINTTVGEIK